MTSGMSEAGSAQGVRCRSFAKVNFYLDVLRKRDDGFHQLETVFQTVSLSDSLECRVTEGELSLSIEGADLPADESNLVMRAAVALREKSGTSPGAAMRGAAMRGAFMRLRKSIPVAAGMAGGSGNAAAALRGLNHLWGLGLPDRELELIAAELGSDVPYCLYGGLMAGTGRGEQLENLEAIPRTWLVLAHPEVSVSTATIFGHPALVKSGAEALADGRSAGFAKAVEACVGGRWEDALFNALESAALVAYPEIAECKRALVEAGCGAVLMSGSGPTVFGVCASEAEAREIAERVSEFRTSVVHTVDEGVVLEELK